MMYSEFYERTQKAVDWDEYKYIEDSYYEFDGDKDEFCKEWLKDVRTGRWEKELRLRKQLDKQKELADKRERELQDNLDFYRRAYDSFHDMYKELKEHYAILNGVLSEMNYTVNHAFDFTDYDKK